jgi:hypothetical protein
MEKEKRYLEIKKELDIGFTRMILMFQTVFILIFIIVGIIFYPLAESEFIDELLISTLAFLSLNPIMVLLKLVILFFIKKEIIKGNVKWKK